MAAEVASPPSRNLSWILGESTPFSLAVLGIGVLSLGLVILGSLIVLLLNGITPVDDLVRGFKSNDFTGVNLIGVIVGVVAMILGWGSYRRMATKVSREQAVAGAVLGAQATVIGLVALWFSEGDVELFAINFMDFERFEGTLGAFVDGAKNTLILALTAEFFGIILGIILAVFAISKRAVVRAPARVFINFFRGTPLVWQLVMHRSRHPHRVAVGHPYLHGGDHRVQPERIGLLGGGVPGGYPVDRAEPAGGGAWPGAVVHASDAVRDPSAGHQTGHPTVDERVRDPHQGHIARDRSWADRRPVRADVRRQQPTTRTRSIPRISSARPSGISRSRFRPSGSSTSSRSACAAVLWGSAHDPDATGRLWKGTDTATRHPQVVREPPRAEGHRP